jgi:flagellar basal-body rod protein FlgG
MIANARHQEALGNNIANMNTPGYKADQAAIRSFPEMLIQAQNSRTLPVNRNVSVPNSQTIGSIHTGVYVQEFVPNFTQGDIRETNLQTDLALVATDVPDESGGLFFRLQTTEGEERLTRNGNFTMDADGFLVTSQGYYVLSDAGTPIQLDSADFTVSDAGVIQTETQTIQLGLGYTADTNELTKEGDNLYAGEAAALPAGTAYTIHQGFLERSNVDAARSMTEMMNAYRSFELNQRVLRAYDESLGMAVSEIGRLG